MKRYLSYHKLPPESLTLDKVREVERLMREEPDLKGYRSFLNLSEGHIVCLIDAPDPDIVGAFFRKLDIPYQSVTEVEIEGERGEFTDLREHAAASAQPER